MQHPHTTTNTASNAIVFACTIAGALLIAGSITLAFKQEKLPVTLQGVQQQDNSSIYNSKEAIQQLNDENQTSKEYHNQSVNTISAWDKLNFPVAAAKVQGYTSPFGFRRHPITGELTKFHYGLDIAVPIGTPVSVWAAGTVVLARDQGPCGTAVAVQSGDWYSVFCHGIPGSNLVKEGDQVTAGQVVQRVGVSGGSTGPHLHWGLKYQGKWVDPTIVLQEMRARQK